MEWLPDAPERRNMENPSHHWDDDEFNDLFGGRNAAGVRVTESTTLGHSPVWRGCSLICNGIAKLPLVLYRNLPGDRGREKDPGHPAYAILRRRANRHMTPNQIISRMTLDAILHGNGLARVLYDNRFRPVGLQLIDPHNVTKYPEHLEDLFYELTFSPGNNVLVPFDEMVHIRFLTSDGIVGYGLLRLAADAIGHGLAAQKYGATFFKNASTPKMVIKSPVHLTPRTRTELRQDFEAAHRNVHNAHRVAIVDNGGDLQPISVNPQEAQLIDTYEWDTRVVANLLNLPPHLLADNAKTSFASLEMEQQSFLDNSLDPWLKTWEAELEYKLLRPEQQSAETHTIKFKRQALVRADIKARAEYYSTMASIQAMTPNEIRSLEEMNAVEWGDEPVQLANLMGKDQGDDAEPEDEPDTEDDARQLASDAVRRVKKQLQTAATKARNRGDLQHWLDIDLESKFFNLVSDVLEPALRVLGECDAATWLGRFRDEQTATP